MTPAVQFLSFKPMLGYGTTEMRCVQPAAYLRAAGWATETGYLYDTMPRASQVAVFHRVPDDPVSRSAEALARQAGCRIVYDLDDLIFEPLDSGAAGDWQSHRRAIERADVVTVSTPFLKDRIDAFHRNCVVVENGLSDAIVARAALAPDQPDKSGVTLAYLSGSAHHDADFALIEDALCAIMTENPDVRLCLMGKLRFSDRFHQFGDRFQYRPFVPYAQFIDVLRTVDINLVPLDTRSDFAQARSALKFIEAAAFGVPTVASPTRTYAEAIEPGRTGLLANDAEWHGALSALVQNSQKRRSLGMAARDAVMKRNGPDAMQRLWETQMRAWTAMPNPPVSSGGHMASLRHRGLLARAALGRQLRRFR